METLILASFCGCLLVCLVADVTIVAALVAGLLLFGGYSLSRGNSLAQTAKMAWKGLRTCRNILVVFVLIGMITAVWRASGTIPMIIYSATQVVEPSVYLLLVFLLNGVVSVLTGTAFGTAATAGAISMAIGLVMGFDPAYLGGAILAGAFVGDRCSPMSTSALLVSTVTGTNIFDNIGGMIKTAIIPFVASCCFYLWLGRGGGTGSTSLEVLELFEQSFALHWVTLLPALLIVVLSLLRLNVKWTMASSIVVSAVLCVAVQGVEIGDLAVFLVTGYQSDNAQLATMLNGGGVTSMIKVMLIVGISSCYSGIFEGTGLLRQLKVGIHRLSEHITPFGGMIVTAILTGAVACNQTLTIMLTNELCHETVGDNKKMAIHLENTAVLISPMIPWSIAGAVPLASAGAPTASILFACYLYLVPLWQLLIQLREKYFYKVQMETTPGRPV